MSFKDDVFEFQDTGDHTLPQRVYVLLLSLLVAGGLALAGVVASYTYTMQPNGWWLIGYFAVALPGIFLAAHCGWFLSLVGYLMVIFATGAITGPYLNLYHLSSVIDIVALTFVLSVGIGLAGAMYPKSVEHWGGFLLVLLLVALLGDIARIFLIGFFGADPGGFVWWHGAVAALFGAYIFYDMNQAMREDYTVDNAVDRAVGLYLDIFNLFVRLLEILGKKK